jgi:CubicO group peptidase (beta-lactamase class C family)
MLGVIFERRTGKSIFDAFAEEIAKPVGMMDFQAADGEYRYEKEKSPIPSYSFRMSARDLALYGLLFLRNGEWNGKQIVPRAWIEASTQTYSIDNPQIGIGYGLLWGTLPETSPLGKAVFHAGLGIHVLMILPADKLVIVNRVDTDAPFTMTGENLFQAIMMLRGAKTPR